MFFEPIAIAASGGSKSATRGVDIELYDADSNTKYFVAVKSGTSIFNADSMKSREKTLQKRKELCGHLGEELGSKQ